MVLLWEAYPTVVLNSKIFCHIVIIQFHLRAIIDSFFLLKYVFPHVRETWANYHAFPQAFYGLFISFISDKSRISATSNKA